MGFIPQGNEEKGLIFEKPLCGSPHEEIGLRN